MFGLTWLVIVTVLAAGIALYDGISRVRGKHSNSILAIAEIVLAALMLLSLFVVFPAPFTLLLFAIVLEVVLVLTLFLGGKRRKAAPILTIIALVLNAVVLLTAAGWLQIPGLG